MRGHAIYANCELSLRQMRRNAGHDGRFQPKIELADLVLWLWQLLMSTILIILILLLIIGGGGGYYYGGPAVGGGIGGLLLIILVVWLLVGNRRV
jgi:hypothetical protein